jgi:hypothetical protein
MKKRVTIEERLLKDMDHKEHLDAQYFYDAKLPSVKLAQSMGIPDDKIEAALNMKIKPQDRSKP